LPTSAQLKKIDQVYKGGTPPYARWNSIEVRDDDNSLGIIGSPLITSTDISVLELGVLAKPLAKVSVPNGVKRSSSGPSASKEESILANSTQIMKTN
jgi:hypothetical protein